MCHVLFLISFTHILFGEVSGVLRAMIIDLDCFTRLSKLRLDYHFSTSFSWLAECVSTWTCQLKGGLWLYIHHDAPWDVSSREHLDQDRWGGSDHCRDWPEWWLEFEIALFPHFKRDALTGGFGGDLHVVFVSKSLPDEDPFAEERTLYEGAHGFITSYHSFRRENGYTTRVSTDVSILSYESYRYSFRS